MKFSFVMLVLMATVILVPIGVDATVHPVNQAPLILYQEPVLDSIKTGMQGSGSPWSECIRRLTKEADRLLSQPPYSVTVKTILPPSGDVHDYASLATYYWPDPRKPNGLPYMNQDGKVNPERENGDRYDSTRMSRMVNAVDTLALVYRLSGNEVYAAKAVEFLKVWFINPDTRMNPNLNFGQGVPGSSTGRYSGIIDTTILVQVIDAARILERSNTFSASDQSSLREWFRSYLDWLQNSKLGRKEAATTNNHGVWYDVQTADFALYTGQPQLAAQIVAGAESRRVQTQIEPDGSMPREQARTRSMHYSIYNLEAFISLARIGDRVGVDLWDYQSADGRSLRRAIDYLIPFLLQEEPWLHQTIIPENEKGFARYLGLAEQHYQTGRYHQAIQFLLKDSKSAKDMIAAGVIP